jgi:tetratricopeptide (TPR) repeat protein
MEFMRRTSSSWWLLLVCALPVCGCGPREMARPQARPAAAGESPRVAVTSIPAERGSDPERFPEPLPLAQPGDCRELWSGVNRAAEPGDDVERAPDQPIVVPAEMFAGATPTAAGKPDDAVQPCAYPTEVPVRRLPTVAAPSPDFGLRLAELPDREPILAAPRNALPAPDIAENDAGPAPFIDDRQPQNRVPQVASGALQAVADKAEQQTREAFVLARRGAIYSARAEMMGALRMIAQALDAEAATDRHTEALAAGATALREADDFTPAGTRPGSTIDLSHVIAGHRTAVLKQANLGELTPLVAAQRYYTFAQEQFAAAAGRAPAASLALYGLGKLQTAVPASGSDAETIATAKAMVYYQAALLVENRNFLAANELAVLLAHVGQWTDARQVLLHGLRVHSQPELWRNLATVHGKLGEQQLADLARMEAARAEREIRSSRPAAGLDTGGGLVQWVTPEWLAQDAGGDAAAVRPAPRSTR